VGASVVLAPIGQKGTQKDRLASWLSDIRTKRDAAENKRVFYVASTRAREELHLFGAASLNTKGELAQPRHDSLLRACWPAAAPHFFALLTEQLPVAEELLSEPFVEQDEPDFALAAAAENAEADQAPMVERLPLSFDPSARFRDASKRRLSYPASSALRHTVAFDRPDGSFAVRAFGNVVHRYLQVLAVQLQQGFTCEDLIAELPSWESRITASLRGEGLPPTLVAREAVRAQRALAMTLADEVGRWILSPHALASSERAVTMAAIGARGLRVDRTFLAGPKPALTGESHLWIIDFKTTLQGSRSDEEFEVTELAKYSQQLETYAALRRTLPGGDLPIQVGLFYPLIPRLLYWRSVAPVDAATT
jgi:ATP-dependent helicase/nuclease subunit A